MKKNLIFLTTLCCSAGAAPYYLPQPAGGALTPYDWQPTWRVDALYAIGSGHTIDTAGFRTGLELYNNGDSPIRHQFGTCVGPQWGTEHRHHIRRKLCTIPLTLGYTLNIGLTDNFFLFLGGKAGWALGHYKERSATHRISESCHGFTFAARGKGEALALQKRDVGGYISFSLAFIGVCSRRKQCRRIRRSFGILSYRYRRGVDGRIPLKGGLARVFGRAL